MFHPIEIIDNFFVYTLMNDHLIIRCSRYQSVCVICSKCKWIFIIIIIVDGGNVPIIYYACRSLKLYYIWFQKKCLECFIFIFLSISFLSSSVITWCIPSVCFETIKSIYIWCTVYTCDVCLLSKPHIFILFVKTQ